MIREFVISMLLITSVIPVVLNQSTVLEDTIYDGVGLVIDHQNNVLVRNNEFRNLGGISPMAIQVLNSYDITIELNIITDITPHPLSDAYGIFIFNSHNITLIDNNLTRIKAAEFPVYGIYIVDSTDITVSGNRISNLGNITSFDIKVENSNLIFIDNNHIEHMYMGNPISIHSTKRISINRNIEVSTGINVFHNISEFEFMLNSWTGQVKITDSINGVIEMEEYFYSNHSLSIKNSDRVRIENNDFIGVSSNFLELKENHEVYYLHNRVNLTESADIKVEILDHDPSIDINSTESLWDVSMIYNFSMLVEITNTSDGLLFTKTLQSARLNASEITISLDWEDIPWNTFNATIHIIDYYNNTYSDNTSLSREILPIELIDSEIEVENNKWYIALLVVLGIFALVIGIRKKTRIDSTELTE